MKVAVSALGRPGGGSRARSAASGSSRTSRGRRTSSAWWPGRAGAGADRPAGRERRDRALGRRGLGGRSGRVVARLRGRPRCVPLLARGRARDDRARTRADRQHRQRLRVPPARDDRLRRARAALYRAAEGLAARSSSHGIFVFTISPGLVKTGMTESTERTRRGRRRSWRRGSSACSRPDGRMR